MSMAGRYYPPITAESYRLNRFMYDLTRANRELMARFLAEREAALEEAPLTDDERDAIAKVDLPRLVRLGAHPFLARGLYTMVHKHEQPDEYVYY